MAKRPLRSHRKKKKLLPFVLGLLTALVLAVVIGGFSTGASLEQHDSFCSTCHTQPETTYVGRTTAAPTDLASYHTTKAANCIDCHSSAGIGGRVSAEMNGATNLVQFVTGHYTQPSKLYAPYSDATCLKCHAEVLAGQAAQNNHFHLFLQRWQAQDPNAGTCTSCHAAHNTDSTADNRFMVDNTTQQVCNNCHAVLARGQ